MQNAYEQKKNLPITSSAYNGKANSVFTTYIPPTKNPSLPPASPIYTPAPPAPPAWAPPPALNTPTTTEFLDFGNYQNNLSVPFYDPINGQGRNDSRAPQIRMGLFNGSKNGCSWIATFNAVRLSGGYVHPADIIQYYEGNLNFFGGLGVGPERVHDFLQQQGYNTTFDKYYVYSSGTSDFDTNMNVGDVMILEYFASGGIGMHYVAIEAISATTGGIEYLVYNEYNNSTSASTYPSIDAWILQQEHIPYAAIGFQ